MPNKSGFTLIELLVVISIIGVLATLVAANLNSARSRARDAQRKSDLKNMSTALRLYYNDHTSFPLQSAFTFGGEFKDSATDTVYMEKLPIDPINDASTNEVYKYVRTDSDTFTLSACLENASDPQGATVASSTCTSTKIFQVKQ
jgi:general secretion pathway protein G